jgi:hypothetical protein
MKAISELPKRGAPISTAVGPSWHSGRGPALENAIGRLQTWIETSQLSPHWSGSVFIADICPPAGRRSSA